jgi:AAA15 family ATPase/GTPase
MFKIESISVNNFKNIVETELPIGDFNVVVGPNNSGKSNFLQVIPFLRWLINGDVKEVEEHLKDGFFPGFSNFFINDNRIGNITLGLSYIHTTTNNAFFYEIQIESGDESGVADLKIVNESLHYKNKNIRGKAARIFERKKFKVEFGKDFFSTKIIEQVPSHVSVLRHLNLIADVQSGLMDYKEAINGLDEILNSPIFFFSSSELRKTAADKPQKSLRFRSIYTDLKANINSVRKLTDWKPFISVLNKTINISDFDFHDDKKSKEPSFFFLKQNGTNKLIDELSDGSLLILSLITEVLTTKSPLILIEEPENSLHPKALTELIHFLHSRTADRQFIITTHSPAFLNLVKPEEVIVARLDEKGNSRLEKIKNLKELKRKLNKGYISFGDLLIDNIDEGEDGEDKEY